MVDLKLQLPNEFYNEEIRCGFKIPTEIKKVWAVELDLLAEFDRVCTKYDFKYFASGGTLLGAVRHKGFIPWDDDIDLAMTRTDYEKLCKVAQKEFSHPFFFQTTYSDPGTLYGHAKLRNSLTTGIMKKELIRKYDFNQGIFIDIFPLDAVPDDQQLFLNQKQIAEKQKLKFKRFSKIVYPGHDGPNKLKFIIRATLSLFIGKLFKNHVLTLYSDFENACKRFNNSDTEFLSMLTFRYKDKRLFIERAYTEHIIKVPFEMLTIPILKDYDVLLTRQYGNYMQMINDPSYHGGMIFDTDITYTDYFKNK